MPFTAWWQEGEGRVCQLIDQYGKVLGEVRPATGHPDSWAFSYDHVEGICGSKDFAMRIVEDKTVMIG